MWRLEEGWILCSIDECNIQQTVRKLSAVIRVGFGASQHGVSLQCIQPGKPVQYACIESFNGKFRDECLNEYWFLTLQEAPEVIDAWHREYNEERLHITIGDMAPMEFINTLRTGPGGTGIRFISPGVTNERGSSRKS